MPYDLEAVRRALKDQLGRRAAPDPTEFKVPKAKPDQEIRYRFYVLGPYREGDQLSTGRANQSMFAYSLPSGTHWFNNRPTPCPRVLTSNHEDWPCDVCTIGFKLMQDAKAQRKDELVRQAIRNQWMPTTGDMVNIYFPPDQINPEELRNQVRWWKSPPTVSKLWYAASLLDGPGNDPLEPLAYGAFFDEMAAFLFELKVKLAGNNNDYKTSRFITRGLRGELAVGPIATRPDGSPDVERIQQILAGRHDLHSKLDKPDVVSAQKLAKQMLGQSQGNFDVDEQHGPGTQSQGQPQGQPYSQPHGQPYGQPQNGPGVQQPWQQPVQQQAPWQQPTQQQPVQQHQPVQQPWQQPVQQAWQQPVQQHQPVQQAPYGTQQPLSGEMPLQESPQAAHFQPSPQQGGYVAPQQAQAPAVSPEAQQSARAAIANSPSMADNPEVMNLLAQLNSRTGGQGQHP